MFAGMTRIQPSEWDIISCSSEVGSDLIANITIVHFGKKLVRVTEASGVKEKIVLKL
jgi:hypothetical protein